MEYRIDEDGTFIKVLNNGEIEPFVCPFMSKQTKRNSDFILCGTYCPFFRYFKNTGYNTDYVEILCGHKIVSYNLNYVSLNYEMKS